MELLLEDIRGTLGAKCVRLPSVATEVDQLIQLMGEALADYEIPDNGPNTHRGMELLRFPGPDASPGGNDDITPLAY